MEDFEPIDVEFLINSEEVKADAQKVRKEIEGVGETAETVEKKVQRSVKRVATEQDAVLNNLRGKVKMTTQDAMQAFEQIDPVIRNNISALVRYEAQLVSLRNAEKELQNDLKRGLITQGQYNKSLAALRAEGLRSSQAMRELSQSIKNQGQVAEVSSGQQKAQWNGLQNSINQIGRELPAFTYSAQTGFMAISNNIPILTDELSRAAKANQALTASGQKAVPVWKQLLSGILNWQTAMVIGITLMTVYGKEIGNFFKELFTGKKAVDQMVLAQESYNKALESTDHKNAITEVLSLRTNLNLAKEGMIDAAVVVDQYNESIGKVTTKVKTLAEVEQGLIDNADNYIKATLAKAAANEAAGKFSQVIVEGKIKELELEEDLIEAQKQLEKQKKIGLQSSGTGLSSNISSAENALRNAEYALQQHRQAVGEEVSALEKIFTDFQKESAGFGIDLYGNNDDPKKTGTKVLSDRRSLLEKIAALDAEYARKSLTKDEEEVQALKDKFGKVRKLVEEWNADPKNKAKRIDLTGLGEIEDRAMSDLRYRQGTAKLKESLDAQKKLYDDFAKTAADFGIQEAERRYQGELDISKTYIDLIREEYDKLANLAPGSMSGPEQERFTFLSEQLAKEEDAQQKQLDSLLKTLQDYNTQRELLIEQHLLRVEELKAKGQENYIAEEERQFQEELNALDIAQIKKLEIFEQFFKGVENLSTKNAKKLIEDIRNTVTQLREEFPNLTKFFDDIETKLNDTEFKLGERMPKDLMDLAQGFRRVAQEVGGVNKGLGQMFGFLSDNLSRVSEIQRGMANFGAARAAGDGFGAVTAGAGVAGAVVGGLITLSSMMKASNEKQTAILKQQLDFQRQIYFGELEINRLVRERAVESAKIEGNTLASLMAQRDILKTNLGDITTDQGTINERLGAVSEDDADDLNRYYGWYKSERDKKLAKLAEGLYIFDTDTVKGGLFGLGKETINIYKTLAGMSFDEIEKLSIGGQLTEDSEKLFQELKKLKEEGEDVERQLKEIENQMKAILTGGATAEGIADSIIEGFRQGKRAVEDFADDVEELLRKAILSGFKYRFLEAPLNELLNQLFVDAQSGDGLDPDEIENFTNAYNNITQSAIDALKDLEAATGINLSDPMGGSSQTGLRGSVDRMTEQTGSELTGLYRAGFDLAKRTFILTEKSLEIERNHLNATLTIMQSSARIEANTADTVERLDEAVVELKRIVKNTDQNSTGYDRGDG